ncbi:MAG: hypothetical protein ACRD8W_00650 [Nitrososphaeraceae archaeon]|jgi:hypothetical protein
MPLQEDYHTVSSFMTRRSADSNIDSFKKKNTDFILELSATTAAGLLSQQAVFTAGGRGYSYMFIPKGNTLYFIIMQS